MEDIGRSISEVMKIEKFKGKFVSFFQKKENWVLLLILAIAAFMRLYRIEDYMTFLGDEGRDVLVAKHILQGDLAFLGPRASAGDFFLGPIYYYFITPFLLIFKYNPVGPAVMVALFGVATVWLVYHIGREFFGKWAGLAAAALYAVSPIVVLYSRSSWNPNPVPFFALLMMFLLYKGLSKNSLKLFLFSGMLYGILMQLHYIVVFLGIIIFLFVLFGDLVQKKRFEIVATIKRFVLFGVGFLITFSPFLAFEIKNRFPNFTTIYHFIFKNTVQNSHEGAEFMDIVTNVWIRLYGVLLVRFPSIEGVKLVTPERLMQWETLIWIMIVLSLAMLFWTKNRLVIYLFLLWLVVGTFLFGFYKKPIYDYYFGFLFPLPFLLVGNALANFYQLPRLKYIGIGVGIVAFVTLFIFNLYGMPFRYAPNRQMNQVRTISEFVLSKTDGKPYNFALLTPGNSDHAYRYFFEVHNQPPVIIENSEKDPQRTSVTDQLLIVCEYGTCSPLGESLWEVAGFGRAEIVGEWKVAPVTVYKLVHYKGNE